MQCRVGEAFDIERVQRDLPVQQGDGHAVGKAVIGGLPRVRMPLFRIASDDFNGHIIAADFNVCDAWKCIDSFYFKQLLSDRQSSFHCRLRVILHRVLFDIGIQDLERDRLRWSLSRLQRAEARTVPTRVS